MKSGFVLVVLLWLAIGVGAQSRNDYDLVVGKFQAFYNRGEGDSIFDMFSPRVQGMLPREKTNAMIKDLDTRLGKLNTCEFSKEDGQRMIYKAKFDNSVLSLIVTLNEHKQLETFRLVLYQADTEAREKQPTDYVLKTTTGSIYGTLTLPDTKGKKVPVVLVIAGSGPTDRDGNSPIGVHANTYLMIADSLNARGIACVRYDKRGIGESSGAMKAEEDLRFGDLVNDAAGFLQKLKSDRRFSKVFVLGHSEGSLVGMLAAAKVPVNGYISVAGIAQRADKVIEKQIALESRSKLDESKIIFDSLVKGYQVSNVDPALGGLFRASVQQYLISWLKYEPQREIRKLKMPVLVVQGTTDMQVDAEEAQRLKTGCPQAKLVMIPDMNHMLKESSENRAENTATYTNPRLPLCPGFIPALTDFIKGD